MPITHIHQSLLQTLHRVLVQYSLISSIYTAVPAPAVQGDAVKAISILEECCPTNPTFALDTAICNITPGDVVFLAELFPCDGIVCEGQWAETQSDPGLSFNNCNNSIEFSSVGYGTYNLASDGMAANKQCRPFNITVSVCIETVPTCISELGEFTITKRRS